MHSHEKFEKLGSEYHIRIKWKVDPFPSYILPPSHVVWKTLGFIKLGEERWMLLWHNIYNFITILPCPRIPLESKINKKIMCQIILRLWASLLTKWKGWMRKCLVQGHYVQTKSSFIHTKRQTAKWIFSSLFRPNSVKMHFYYH